VGGNADQGKVYVFDGPTGRLLYAIDNPRPQADGSFGARIGSAGDVTGDGRPDIIVGATANDLPAGCGTLATVPAGCQKNVGQAFIFDGANGALVRELNTPPADVPAGCTGCGNFGGSTQVLGDLNGDGFPDQLVAAYTLKPAPDRHGRIYVFSGKDGALLTRIDQPVPDPVAFFGLQEVAPNTPGDVNGDGVADIYGTGFLQDGANGQASAGRAWVFDGKASVTTGRGVVLYELNDPTPQASEAFGFNASRTDYNKDGVPDLYLSSLQGLNTETYVYDGRDGSLLKTLSMPAADVQPNAPGNSGSALGFSSRAPGDLNGDGEPDFVLSRPPAAPPAPPAPRGTPGTPGTPPPASQPGLLTAKLSLARATINRRDRVLDVLAPITSLASGRVNVELHAAGRRYRFTAPVNSRDGRIRFRQRIPAAQARLGTGIVTITYRGDSDTRPQTVRLRAAIGKAELRLARPTITADGRLRASGTVSRRARGVVRVQIEYVTDAKTITRQYLARISNGRWSLNQALSPAIRAEIGRRSGTVHSYTLFTGYLQARMRGEMRSYQVLGAR